jgi:hypothetical protein
VGRPPPPPTAMYDCFSTTTGGGLLGAPSTDFGSVQYAFTTDQPPKEFKPSLIINLEAAITLVKLDPEIASLLLSKNVGLHNGFVTLSSAAHAMKVLLDRYRSQPLLETPLCFKPPPKKGKKRKRQLSITKARGSGNHRSTSKNGARLGYGAEDEDEDEDEARYSQALPAEQIKSLSLEDVFQIWVADDKNTLGATSDLVVQKKNPESNSSALRRVDGCPHHKGRDRSYIQRNDTDGISMDEDVARFSSTRNTMGPKGKPFYLICFMPALNT